MHRKAPMFLSTTLALACAFSLYYLHKPHITSINAIPVFKVTDYTN